MQRWIVGSSQTPSQLWEDYFQCCICIQLNGLGTDDALQYKGPRRQNDKLFAHVPGTMRTYTIEIIVGVLKPIIICTRRSITARACIARDSVYGLDGNERKHRAKRKRRTKRGASPLHARPRHSACTFARAPRARAHTPRCRRQCPRGSSPSTVTPESAPRARLMCADELGLQPASVRGGRRVLLRP
jgi:hypothetical protein